MSKNMIIARKFFLEAQNQKYPILLANNEDSTVVWNNFNGNASYCWTVDFETEYYITNVEVEWERENIYIYSIEVSLDNTNWVIAYDNKESIKMSKLTKDNINTRARFIKINVIPELNETVPLSILQFKAISSKAHEFVTGTDVSALQQIEDFGGKYYNRKGEIQDCMEILKDHGVNYIRLKIWNKPGLPNSDPKGYNDKAHVLEMAKRVKNNGFKFLLDFHYSDWWVDPGKQFIPNDWKNLTYEEIIVAIYNYTYDVLWDLKEQGTLPEMVQVGNEITNGMIWNVGKVSEEFDTPQQWDRLAEFVKSGLRAVNDVDSSIKTIIHIERGGDNERCRYFYDNIINRGVIFDIIGLSYYPIWHGPILDFKNNIVDLASRYNKGINVVETAYPYTTESGDEQPNATTFQFTKKLLDYPPTINNQANILQAIISALKSLPDGKGMGFFYWQPDFIPVKGAGWKYGEGCEWDDQTMFDFTGHALWSLDIFKMHCTDRKF